MPAGYPLVEDLRFAARMARLEIGQKTRKPPICACWPKQLAGNPWIRESLLKIHDTEIRQEISSLLRRAVGICARPYVVAALDVAFDGPRIGSRQAASAAVRAFHHRVGACSHPRKPFSPKGDHGHGCTAMVGCDRSVAGSCRYFAVMKYCNSSGRLPPTGIQGGHCRCSDK